MSSAPDGRVQLYRGNGSGLVTFDAELAIPGLTGITELAVANRDLIVVSRESDVFVAPADLSSFELLTDAVWSVDDLASGDLDGDGADDLVVAGETDAHTGVVAIYYARTGGYEAGGTLTVPGDFVRGVAVADLDGDGKADIVATSDAAGVSVFRGK